LVEAEHYPNDFDGIIAGDPYFDIEGEAVSAVAGISAQLRTADATLGPEQWHLADRVILEKCDAADGVRDGLIQNPARCDFVAERDLPICRSTGEKTCFTEAQAQSLGIALRSLRDREGHEIYPGYPAADLDDAAPDADNMHYWLGFDTSPGGWRTPASQPQAWYYGNETLRYFARLGPSDISFAPFEGALHAVIDKAAFAAFHAAVSAGDGTDPASLDAFIRAGHKLILFHGLADGDITPYRTMNFYRALAARNGGYTELGRHVAFFTVPGMAHCGGGPGPNSFGQSGATGELGDAGHNILATLDQWVTSDRSVRNVIATKYTGDQPTGRVLRTMPLCPFPGIAHYDGHGPVNEASSWTCTPGDRSLLESGTSGRSAGYAP